MILGSDLRSKPSRDQLNAATFATLDGRPATPEGRRLIKDVSERVQAFEHATGLRKRQRSAVAAASFDTAVSAFVADLLSARQDPPQCGLVYRSTRSNSFSTGPVSYRAFMAALKAMQALELVHAVAGYRRDVDYGFAVDRRGKAPRFRAGPALLQIAQEHLGDEDWRAHFHYPRSKRLVALKASSVWEWGRKARGKALPLPDTLDVRLIADRVRAINAFLDGVEISGGRHTQFFRSFDMGDRPDFRWNKGGRLYSDGPGNYQQAKAEQRARITLDGEPVSEIDVKASFLTILHGITQEPFDPHSDPYGIEGLPRDIVKGWVTTTIGAGRIPRRWPRKLKDDYRAKVGRELQADHRLRDVETAVLAKLPILARLADLGLSWADLMFLESEAIMGAIVELQEQDVPSLPVHDSLLVPVAKAELASAVLKSRYVAIAGVEPLLELKTFSM